MSTYLTWAQMWARIQASELDLSDETFVSKAECMEFANEAINEAEALIHGIYEDYFLVPGNISLVDGTDSYALPTDIYAMKVRSLFYVNGETQCEVKRIKEFSKFQTYRAARSTSVSGVTGGQYVYFLVNVTAGAPAVKLSPVPRETVSNALEVWYIRNATRLTADADVCDIPEFIQFVYDHIRCKVYEKEGHFALQKALADKEATRMLMVDTLTEMIPDHDNEIEADLSHYQEHV